MEKVSMMYYYGFHKKVKKMMGSCKKKIIFSACILQGSLVYKSTEKAVLLFTRELCRIYAEKGSFFAFFSLVVKTVDSTVWTLL